MRCWAACCCARDSNSVYFNGYVHTYLVLRFTYTYATMQCSKAQRMCEWPITQFYRLLKLFKSYHSHRLGIGKWNIEILIQVGEPLITITSKIATVQEPTIDNGLNRSETSLIILKNSRRCNSPVHTAEPCLKMHKTIQKNSNKHKLNSTTFLLNQTNAVTQWNCEMFNKKIFKLHCR